MNKIIRIWNQNRKLIIIGALVVVFVIILVQVLNQMAKAQKEQNNNYKNMVKENVEGLPTQSIITGEKVDTNTTKTNNQIIEEFVKKCNNKDITGAYQMLTDECKKILFNTEEDFTKGYYNVVFKENRICDIENYRNSSNLYTYRVKLYNDILSTGNSDNASSYQDYITIDKNLGKININSLIDVKEINKYEEKNGIKITVINRQIYKDYEKYQVKVENNTSNRIITDTRKGSRSVYVLGTNNVSYSAYTNEIASYLFEIPAKFNKIYDIKFNKIYNGIGIKSLTFSDIVENYESYNQNPEQVKERLKITVNI